MIKVLKSFFLCIIVVGVAVVPPPPAQADTLAGEPILFPETGHTLAYSFRLFYDRHGGIDIFGLPLTEVYLEDGYPVQYFERARFEWHAQSARVQASHLGRWAAQQRQHLPAFAPLAQPPADGEFFRQTGHSLRGAFLQFWLERDGLTTFGYPLSEEFAERNEQDGQIYTVQYFERARFEYHPELPPGSQIQLSHLGRQHLAAHPAPDWALQPANDATQAWGAIRPERVAVPRIGINAEISMTGFSFGEWEVPRYTIAHYWPVSAFPNTAGNIVLAGHVGYRDTLFNYLPNIQVGDEVFVQAGGVDRRYIVQEVLTLLPSDTWVMTPTPTETLTLITCIPINVYSHRLIVRATPAS
jgi:LPXTG-site transpeptidase (sortase) family protein